jgi:hypothetical protein
LAFTFSPRARKQGLDLPQLGDELLFVVSHGLRCFCESRSLSG